MSPAPTPAPATHLGMTSTPAPATYLGMTSTGWRNLGVGASALGTVAGIYSSLSAADGAMKDAHRQVAAIKTGTTSAYQEMMLASGTARRNSLWLLNRSREEEGLRRAKAVADTASMVANAQARGVSIDSGSVKAISESLALTYEEEARFRNADTLEQAVGLMQQSHAFETQYENQVLADAYAAQNALAAGRARRDQAYAQAVGGAMRGIASIASFGIAS